MSRESLIRRALELQRLTKDARATLSLAAGEEAAGDILGLLDEIVRRTGEFLSSGTKNVHDFEKLQLLMQEVKRLLDAAHRGMGSPPLRKLDADDEQSQDEEPANDDQKSPQEDFAVSIVPRRKRKADSEDSEAIDVEDDEEDDDKSDPRRGTVARWPSEQMKPPSQGKAVHGLAKSLSARDERLRILYAEPDIHDLLSPVSRKRKGSAIVNVRQG